MAAIEESETGFDPKRRLCPDGACVGIIGDDGRCTVCGAAAGAGAAPAAWHDDPADDEDSPVEAGADTGATFDPNRRLCSDDGCIGVIGPDNRCGVCGKPAAS